MRDLRGHIYAILAYVMWGLLPVYWKLIKSIPALEILSHRIIWSFVFLLCVVVLSRHTANIRWALSRKKVVVLFLASSVLLSINWMVYIWAVNSNFILEASLGYYINPLVSVLLGVAFLKEKLRRMQLLSVILAGCGVFWLAYNYGSLPWIALILATSFAFYGLLRKIAELDSLDGLFLETLLLSIPCLIFLSFNQEKALGDASLSIILLLILTGPITAIPLLLYASSARLLTLKMLGIFQYITPTLQFLLGVWVYNEPFYGYHLLSFAFIWAAVVIFLVDNIRLIRDSRAS